MGFSSIFQNSLCVVNKVPLTPKKVPRDAVKMLDSGWFLTFSLPEGDSEVKISVEVAYFGTWLPERWGGGEWENVTEKKTEPKCRPAATVASCRIIGKCACQLFHYTVWVPSYWCLLVTGCFWGVWVSYLTWEGVVGYETREWESAAGGMWRSGDVYGGSDRTKTSATDRNSVEGGLIPSLSSMQWLLTRKLTGLKRLYVHVHTCVCTSMHTYKCVYNRTIIKRDHEFGKEHGRSDRDSGFMYKVPLKNFKK